MTTKDLEWIVYRRPRLLVGLPGSAIFEFSADRRYNDPHFIGDDFGVERRMCFNAEAQMSYDGNHGSHLSLGTAVRSADPE